MVTLSEFEGHFCCSEWQSTSCGLPATAELLVFNWGGVDRNCRNLLQIIF